MDEGEGTVMRCFGTTLCRCLDLPPPESGRNTSAGRTARINFPGQPALFQQSLGWLDKAPGSSGKSRPLLKAARSATSRYAAAVLHGPSRIVVGQ